MLVWLLCLEAASRRAAECLRGAGHCEICKRGTGSARARACRAFGPERIGKLPRALRAYAISGVPLDAKKKRQRCSRPRPPRPCPGQSSVRGRIGPATLSRWQRRQGAAGRGGDAGAGTGSGPATLGGGRHATGTASGNSSAFFSFLSSRAVRRLCPLPRKIYTTSKSYTSWKPVRCAHVPIGACARAPGQGSSSSKACHAIHGAAGGRCAESSRRGADRPRSAAGGRKAAGG